MFIPATMPRKKRHNSIPLVAAKTSRRRSVTSTEQVHTIEQHDATELTCAFGADTNAVKQVREKDQLFSLVDVTMLVTGKDCNYAAQHIRFLRERYNELHEKIINFKFPGPGQHDTPAGDIYVVVELIMLLPGRRAGLVRGEAARLFATFYGDDLSLAEQFVHNRGRKDELVQENPRQPTRAFGRAVEAVHSVHSNSVEPKQLQKTCKDIVARTLIPAMTRVIDKMFASKINEAVHQAATAQVEWQQAALRQIDITLREIGRSSSRPIVNINTSTRHQGDLDRINVDAPETTEDAARLRSAASPLTKFLRERWQHEWVRAGVRHTSYTIHFSILMQAGSVFVV